MPPKEKSLEANLQDDTIDSITAKITQKKPDALRTVLQAPQKTMPTENFPVTTPEVSESVKRLRTYQSDVADAVKAKQESVVSISLAEKKRAEMRGESIEKPRSGVNKLVIGFVSLLLVGGGAFAMYVTFKKGENTNTPIQTPKPSSLISANKESEFAVGNLNQTNLQSTLKTEVDQLGVTLGTLGTLRIVENAGDTKQITPERFLALIGTTAPGGLVRSLEEFMLGAYGKELGAEPFLVFKTKSFEQAFAGMLSWEKTLANDLKDFFGTENAAFRDVFIKNRDVRALRDTSGTTVLLYSFLDPKTFVIAHSEEAFIAVLNQFNTGQVAR